MNNQTYTGQQVKEMLAKSMVQFQKSMVQVIRECAASSKYRDMNPQDALNLVADKLEGLK